MSFGELHKTLTATSGHLNQCAPTKPYTPDSLHFPEASEPSSARRTAATSVQVFTATVRLQGIIGHVLGDAKQSERSYNLRASSGVEELIGSRDIFVGESR